MLKILNKLLIRIKAIRGSAKKLKKGANVDRLFKNPLFFFGSISIMLFGGIYVSSDSLDNSGHNHIAFFNSFFNKSDKLSGDNLFSSQSDAIPLETPDLKIMQNNTICAMATPCVVSGKVLGDVFGGSNLDSKEIIDYEVQSGDTIQSIAEAHKISLDTLLWANDLTPSSKIKVGDSLVVLPTDGVLHVVKSGDTISAIASKYKAQSDNIISYNTLANQSDIYIGDILVIPGGVMPKKAAPIISHQAPIANKFFIIPTQGHITQGLHYFNAIDVANKCGTPVYAAASGVVQRAVGNGGYNSGMGNHITILHSNGTVTYYGHLSSVLVKPGDKVYTGQNIGLMGHTGHTIPDGPNGCHLHFQVVGAKNPLAVYPKGSTVKYK